MTPVRAVFLALAAFLCLSQAHPQTAPPTPKFYAYCVELGVPNVTPHPLADQVKLLRDLGFDGLGWELWLDDTIAPSLKVIEDADLGLYLVWTSVNLNPAQAAFDPRLPSAIRKLKGRPVTVSVLLRGFKPGDPQGIEPAVKVLRQLGDVAAEAGVRLSIYNHVNDWSESLPFIVETVKRVNHPQVGFNFNLCHWLKVEGARDWRPVLRENVAKLFCVTINGATVGAETWTHGLIRPLDEGDFDNRALLATLREIGYRGPVGLMCYGVPGEPREHLARSMRTWRKLLPAVTAEP
jgi:sugar phosphate isomerase/epimerase